ncbi:MAG: helix-turn-helix domain-containing protein [Piscinibacter sp.]|uniref:LexA family protein n=1 Tax=Piscinibacter sp. TaxID=1903157 RepID=UPI002590EE9B|nr:helix-turn-helix domain-containing protein [Piscinibacter sp.]MCW5666506.1 helix-turn-helix domain-containing protein [Piscinibacter sp.]
MRKPIPRDPTPADLAVLRSVKRHVRAWRCAPTRAELSTELGVSRPTVEFHLQTLSASGLLRLTKQWRGIELTERGRSCRT